MLQITKIKSADCGRLHYILLAILLIAIFADPIKPSTAYSSILYKSYIVRYDRGWDILCEPYIVQKNDWVTKLFKQKGEIAQKDYPEFISIFRRLNPRVYNIDLIRIGQYILIPLKKLRKDFLPGQSSGIVTIPFVTISKITEILNTHSTKYIVRKGDCVSILVARRFGAFGSESYKKGFELFNFINPAIANPNFIYPGQVLHLPNASLQKEPWYYSLFDGLGKIKRDIHLKGKSPAKEIAPKDQPIVSKDQPVVSKAMPIVPKAQPVASKAMPVVPKDQPVALKKQPIVLKDQSVQLGASFFKTASILDAKLLDKGTYHFPGKKEEEFELDLSKFPMLEFKDGTIIIFTGESQIKEPDLSVLKSSWSDVNVISIAPDASMEQILDSVFNVIKKGPYVNRVSFSDHCVKAVVRAKWITDKPYITEKKRRYLCITLIEDLSERTPESISRYMDQHGMAIIDILVDNNETKQRPQIVEKRYPIAKDVITISATNRRTFVNDLVTALGFRYSKNVKITFPYAGIQIDAMSNLVTTKDGSHLLIDFEDLYGDAISSIQKSGFDIIQVKKKDNPTTIIQNFLKGMGISYTNNPTFFAAKRPATYNTALTVNGFLIKNIGSPNSIIKELFESDNPGAKVPKRNVKILLAAYPLHEEVIQFLRDEGVKIIMIDLGKLG